MIECSVKLPEGRVYYVPTDPEKIFDESPLEISPRWAAERTPKKDMWVELGGPRHDYKSFCLIRVKDPSEIEAGRIEIIGPELNELEPGTSYPFGYWMNVGGEGLTDEYVGYFDKWLMDNHVKQEGVLWLNTRDQVWMRIHKRLMGRIDSWKYILMAPIGMFMSQIPFAEAIEIKFLIATPELGGKDLIAEIIEKDCKPHWDAQDAKALELRDEDVDTFFGCTLCQSFAPNHCCVISPDRTPFCGVVNWTNTRVCIEVDPTGYNFYMPKGECIDPKMGAYTGVQKALYERSNRTLKKVNMYSAIKYPMTSCGCFEALIFYIPEVDGLGVVNRIYTGETPLGLTFSKIAGMCGGGVQYHGYCGVCLLTMKSPKFVQGDGGWDRVVWICKNLKEKLAGTIPETHYSLIATEEDATDPITLKEFLRKKKHPIVEKFWKNGEPVPLEIPGPGELWPEDKHLEEEG
ncbi:MAG: CO dehydrogenase/CO-methylating acetyl-CoA synthase complex subunit beta [Candidatus Syntropharchaeia archaeon]